MSKASNNWPSEVKIGGIPFRVTYPPRNDERLSTGDPEAPTCDGKIQTGYQQIYVEGSLAPDYKRGVLLHEIVHGVVNFMDMWEEPLDECGVTRLANAIDLVLRDNPGLVRLYQA